MGKLSVIKIYVCMTTYLFQFCDRIVVLILRLSVQIDEKQKQQKV